MAHWLSKKNIIMNLLHYFHILYVNDQYIEEFSI